MKIVIIYYNFLQESTRELCVGGVETYIWHLCKLASEKGFEPLVIQPAKKHFEEQIGRIRTVGVEIKPWFSNLRRQLYEYAVSCTNPKSDILIFGADHISVHTNRKRCILIQHGISWDLPPEHLAVSTKGIRLPHCLRKRYLSARFVRYFNNCRNRVCVDYNFLNWYRTQALHLPEGNIWIVPNFVDLDVLPRYPMKKDMGKIISIVFARRFFEIRGSRLFGEVARELLGRFQDIRITFAGEGPDEAFLRDVFRADKRVSFRKYHPEEAVRFHCDYDIAVVPSLGSEGTSLSLLEAMAAGCAVVASNLGGLTNIVINGFNGLLVNPNVHDFYRAIEVLLKSESLRKKLGGNAKIVVSEAFGLKRWKEDWSNIVDTVSKTES